MAILIGFKPYVLNTYAALVGEKPGYAALQEHLQFIAAPGVGVTGYKAALEGYFGSTPTATLAASLLTNLGLGGSFSQAQAEAFLDSNPNNRVGAIIDLAQQLYSYAGTDAALMAAKVEYAAKIDNSNAYSSNASNVNGEALGANAGQTLSLTTGFDSLIGTAFADTFLARTINNGNTFQDGDSLDGGAGVDTVYIDFTGLGNAITPLLKNIENVVVRAQTTTADPTNGNNTSGTVQIDAQRSLAVDSANKVTADTGVAMWESSNSRSDVIIEDVRIGNAQKTSDVTIAFRESDPGNVDLGVYFDQHSLRNASTGSSTLTINLMDTGAAAATATSATPLLNNPYDTFKLGINGVLAEIALDKVAVAAADTYEDLLVVFNTALAPSGIVATLSGTFTITDPLSNKAVTGKSIVLTSAGAVTITTPDGSGWFNTTGASVPASSNIFTTFSTAASSVTELVTSKVILDDVGRGSTGGDLVVGGMSVGSTSTSRGVERFEITVEDSSKLQTINGTNNALREVTIVNSATSNSSTAYNTVAANAGNLTVNGRVAKLDATLAGVETGSAAFHDRAGFTDVRLIDASAMTGKFEFTAAITVDTIKKFVTQIDNAANPFADVAGTGNVNFDVPGANFIYSGGANNDTMAVTLDSGVLGSRSTIVSGLSDVTFVANGGAGNDAITVTVVDQTGQMAGGAQAWYNNQKLNANIALNGGDGNDTIRTPGAGDVIIDAGTGDDVVYTDNTGAFAGTPTSGAAASLAAIAYANAAAAELAAGQAAAVASNTTGFNYVAGTGTAQAVSAATTAAALNTLNLVTPVDFPAAPITHATIEAAINAATAAGGLTFAQELALNTAYNVTTGGVVTPKTTLTAQTITGEVAVAGNLTAAEFAAGNALLDTYIAAAKAAAAAATANDALVAANAAYDATGGAVATELLNTTQKAVVAATQAVNKVYDPLLSSGLTYTPVVTQGVNEINTFANAVGLLANETITINGLTVTDNGAGSTAANVQLALTTGAAPGITVAGANNNAAWTVAAGAGTTVVYTSVLTGNPVDLTNTGTGNAGANTVTAATTESVAVTIAGTGLPGETVTIDGVVHAVGGSAAAAVAALIDGAADGANYSDAAVGAVVTFSSLVAGNVADLAAPVIGAATAAAAGTQTTVNNLAALQSALAVGATDATVVTALQTAVNNGAISAAQATALFAQAVATAGTIDATELGNLNLILAPIVNTATNANTTAQATLTAALAADVAAVNAAAAVAAGAPAGTGALPDNTGAGGAAAAATAATAALTAFNTATLTPATTKAADLAALKAAIAVGTTELQTSLLTTNAVAKGTILAGDKTAIDAAANATVPTVAGTVDATEKTAVDLLITALQVTQDIVLAAATQQAASLQSIVTATALASAIATEAANSGTGAAGTSPKAVFVFDTTNQTAAYNRTTMDDRNLADLKSDANNSYNFFNSTVKVTYKGLDASVIVAGTGFKTTDLEINQAIKQAINTDPVLKTLLVATDGPGNTLVVTSLIDGTHTTANLAVTVTMPTSAGANVAAAAAAYGLAAGSTDAQVIAAMTAAKATFDTKGDYVTQFAESGANGGNANLTGANSLASTDNTVTPGTGNDVIVLGTTESIVDTMSSSNEKVVYAGTFGNDTIVHFDASGNGIDTLDFSALNGRASAFGSLSADKSIVVGAPVATALTAAQIAALFTDSATAINHVYVAVDNNNIGSVWQVADAAGTAAGNVVASLVGSIDLADTAWGNLTAANFA